jgi:hypothetical protein
LSKVDYFSENLTFKIIVFNGWKDGWMGGWMED